MRIFSASRGLPAGILEGDQVECWVGHPPGSQSWGVTGRGFCSVICKLEDSIYSLTHPQRNKHVIGEAGTQMDSDQSLTLSFPQRHFSGANYVSWYIYQLPDPHVFSEV